MKPRYVNIIAGISLLASFSYESQAEAFLAGAKSTGMAAVGAAYPQDAYAGATNPAGIVDVPDRIDVGITWIQDRGHSRLKDNLAPIPGINRKYGAFKTKDVYDGDFGINKVFCTEFCGRTWTWAAGLVVYNRDYQKTTYNRVIPLLGTSHPGLEYLHETIAPVFAVSISDCISIGVSVDVHVQRAKVNGLENFRVLAPPAPVGSLYPNKVTNKGYSYSSGVGATIGAKWQVNDCFSLGVTYRTKAKMSKFHDYKGFLAQRGLLNIPQKVLGGLAWRFLPCATLAFDVEWIDWSQIKSLRNRLLRNGNPFPQPLGSKNGPGFGFRNQTFYRVGLDYAITDRITLRAGFRHTNAPIRRSQTAVNLLTCDCVEDFATVGFSYVWNCAEFSMFYGHGFSKKIRGKNSVPAFLGGGNIDLVEAKNALGISIGYMF